ncbi:hypothetical protein [Spirosoma pollinicola]|uniref:Uncharacterized protein n=1 Tax=Spirosoma pollinicola TaxID=2057025 RepID=A0A2K8Z497_9BACT|nr:hypothetical protein [Spirosoma pollinicola]AUD04692.1 hypothetical protein CWM47_24300 [Spirosoma pollinicola]
MLTPAQLTAIKQHLRETNLLSNEELILELTDHYSLAIEDQLAQGTTFDTALATADAGFGNQPGLLSLEKHYTNASNLAFWQTVLHKLKDYTALPRLIGLFSLTGILYYLLSNFWQATFCGLVILTITLYIIVGRPFFRFPSSKTNYIHEWDNRPYWIYRRRTAGLEWVSNVLLGIGFNVPLFLSVLPTLFSEHTHERFFVFFSAVCFTVSLLSFVIVAELTFQQNPILKRLAASE